MTKLKFLFSLTVISVLVFSLAGNALAKGPEADRLRRWGIIDIPAG